MPNGDDSQRTLTLPLAEGLLRAPAEAICQGVQQMNVAAQRSGFPQLPDPSEPPRLFGSRHNSGR